MRAIRFNWTPERVQQLRALYPDFSADIVARVMGGSVNAIYSKAHALGLSKSEAFRASQQSGRIQRGRQHPAMVATQFRPGLTPWNKGVAGSTGLHPNCRPTQFKPGRQPHEARNYQPIGSLRISSKDHYLERKVTDDQRIAPARRWVAEHRLVWEAAHGPIPPGHIVVFKPGMKTAVLEDITAVRLECISRADNARRNHPATKSPELARLVQLKGAITRQVNRITREQRAA